MTFYSIIISIGAIIMLFVVADILEKREKIQSEKINNEKFRNKYERNIFSKMSMDEIKKYIFVLLSMSFEKITSSDIRSIDPEASMKLISSLVTDVYVNIGESNLEIIHERFGPDFVTHIITLNVSVLMNRGIITKGVRQDVVADEFYRELIALNHMK